MTYDEALLVINSTDVYHLNENGFKAKLKIVPKKKDDLIRYYTDLFSKGIIINNYDVKKYSSDSEYEVMSILCRFLPEENF